MTIDIIRNGRTLEHPSEHTMSSTAVACGGPMTDEPPNSAPTVATPAPTDGSRRDDFPRRVRSQISAEVGFRCSNPHCGAPTIGPSAETGKIVDVGVAAHITAARANGPRYDVNLTSEQRKHEDNAIWLCQFCGKLVDSDESTHDVPQLRKWKIDAIALAARALKMRDIDPDGQLKLAREERHRLAVKVLRAAMVARASIMIGVDLAKSICEAVRGPASELVALQGTVNQWYERVRLASEACEAAMFDVRVVLGPSHQAAGLIELEVRLDTWRNWFSENLLILAKQKARHVRVQQDAWNWDLVFRGDEQHTSIMLAQITNDTHNVEAWTAPFIAGREP